MTPVMVTNRLFLPSRTVLVFVNHTPHVAGEQPVKADTWEAREFGFLEAWAVVAENSAVSAPGMSRTASSSMAAVDLPGARPPVKSRV